MKKNAKATVNVVIKSGMVQQIFSTSDDIAVNVIDLDVQGVGERIMAGNRVMALEKQVGKGIFEIPA
jgi:hypothetical protein